MGSLAVELIAASSGLGFVILQVGDYLNTSLVYAVMLAALHVEEAYRPDRRAEAQGVFGTTDPTHPTPVILQRDDLLLAATRCALSSTMTPKDPDGTSRAEYLFGTALTATRQTTDCAPNGYRVSRAIGP